MIYAVALDGPSGAGKSTVAKAVAKKLQIVYVDTGAIYRSVGLFVLRKNISSTDKEKIIALLPEISVDIRYIDGSQHIFLNNEDVSSLIRTETVSKYASDVSAIPQVRAHLLSMQRKIAEENSVIMDGRDIGTVVLPDAKVKVFLTASPETRAKRRYKELIEKGENVVYEDVLAAIIRRDKNDSERETAPLKAAEDAVLVDSSELTLDETVEKIISVIKEKIG